jgi:DNA adenine methylase
VNADLIDTYKIAARPDECRELIGLLRGMPWSEEAYYKVRDWRPDAPINRASRFVYLNRAGFNGLHRVNARGEFNVPFGNHDQNPIGEALFRRITAAGALLAKATIALGDFRRVMSRGGGPREGDAVYLDPPYLPIGKTSFAAYDRNGFGIEETEALAEHARRLAEKGVHVLLSNADTPEVRRIFADFRIETVTARRSINSKGAGRGAVGEVLISPFGQAR